MDLAQRKIPIIAVRFQEGELIPEGAICFEELVNAKYDIDDIILEHSNDTIVMPYSSGTTGLPKGVEHTHQSLIANMCQINSYYFKITEDATDSYQDVTLAVLPWFHIYGLAVILLNKLHTLSKLVAFPQFTHELYIKGLQEHKPQLLMIVPSLINLMIANPFVKKEYLESTRYILSGAASLGSLDEERVTKRFGEHINIIQGYGLTETLVLLHLSTFRKLRLNISGSVGEVLPNTLAKVVPVDNPLEKPLGPHKLGELLVKGPQVMKRYYNNTEETNKSFVDGWFRTGDLVYYDENSMFYIRDRLKELIKVKAFQVAPAELEEVLRSYPDVADAAVIGIPDDTYGEVPRAYVVPKSNTKIDVGKLGAFMNEKVANYKQIKGGFVVLESIPKNAAGKILKKELRKLYETEKAN